MKPLVIVKGRAIGDKQQQQEEEDGGKEMEVRIESRKVRSLDSC